MELRLVRFNDQLKEEWDHFIENVAKNATFLHSRRFYNHNPLNKGDDCSLLFYKGNELIALLPANLYVKDGYKIFHSYLRSTYGGFLFSNHVSINDLDYTLQLLISFLKEENVDEIIIRPTFLIYHSTLSQELDYLLWKNAFKVKFRELELAVDLYLDTESLYADSTRRNIRKATRSGVIVMESSDLESYWIILEKNLMDRYGKKPVHSLEEMKLLKLLVGQEKVRLFTATLNGRAIGGILAFVSNSRVLHAQYIAADKDFQELRPLNLVIDFIIKKAKEEGFKYFNLGMVTEPGGHEMNEGLCRFKESFGARGVLRETMHLQLTY